MGDAPLKRIEYYFFRGRLCSITLIADITHEKSIISTLQSAYGKGFYANDSHGHPSYHWYAETVMLYCKTYNSLEQDGQLVEASFESIPIYAEIAKEQEKQKEKAKFNQANGL